MYGFPKTAPGLVIHGALQNGRSLMAQSNLYRVPLTFWSNVIRVAVVFTCIAVNSGAFNAYASWMINPDPLTNRDAIAISENVNLEDSVMKKITNEEL